MTYTFELGWGGFGSGDRNFEVPFDIDIDTSGYVYVVDRMARPRT